MKDLFIGSEGTLGVITGATVRLHPLPEVSASAVVTFPSEAAAVRTVVQAISRAVPLVTMELLDALAVRVRHN